MSSRYRLTLAVEFTAGDDPAARTTVTRNLDALGEQAASLRACVTAVDRHGAPVKLKLQRLNDDVGAPPRSLVVEAL